MKVCNGYPLLISRFLDGDLSPVEERELREHLASCEACRLYYQQLSAIGEQLHEDIPYPANLHRSIMGAVAAERKKVVRFRPRRLIGAVAAAVAVCVVAGVTARGGLFRMSSAKSESAAPEISPSAQKWPDTQSPAEYAAKPNVVDTSSTGSTAFARTLAFFARS